MLYRLLPAAFALGVPASAQSLLRTISDPDMTEFGRDIAVVPDENGDGFDDLLVGLPRGGIFGTQQLGDVWLYSGQWIVDGTGVDILRSWSGTPGAPCLPGVYPHFGVSVDGGVDVDLDGVNDVLIGEPGISRMALIDGASGYDLFDQTADAYVMNNCYRSYGAEVAFVGDVNGDNYPDFAAGAPGLGTPGNPTQSIVRIYSGEWYARTINIATPFSNRRLLNLVGNNPSDGFGRSIVGLGDLDGDGNDDVAVGASGLATTPYARVHSGASGALLATLNEGWVVANAGDMDGDGLNELALGSPSFVGANGAIGRVRVYTGEWLAGGAGNGLLFEILPVNPNARSFGFSIESVGDLNGDGAPELLIGSSAQTTALQLVSGRTGEAMWELPPSITATHGTSLARLDGPSGTPYLVAGGHYPGTSSVGVLSVFSAFDAVGDTSCDGSLCPCGNTAPIGGCINNAGTAGILAAEGGNTSIADDELRFVTTGLPPFQLALLVVSDVPTSAVLGNGRLCVGLPFHRYPMSQTDGAGRVDQGPGLFGFAQGNFAGLAVVPGTTLHFQTWYRDTGGPCGQLSNLSNAYGLLLVP